MTLAEIKKRWTWEYLYPKLGKLMAASLVIDVEKLTNFAEATIAYFHAEPKDDHEAWKRFQDARKELEKP